MRAARFPLHVVHGPERLTRTAPTDTTVIVERDRDAGDSFDTVHGSHRNPRRVATRLVGAKATIWAKSNAPGARDAEHEDLCDQIVDAFYVRLRIWIHGHTGGALLAVRESRYLKSAELNGLETWPGVAYLMRWTVPRGVTGANYKGAGLPETALNGITNRTEIRRSAGDTPENVET